MKCSILPKIKDSVNLYAIFNILYNSYSHYNSNNSLQFLFYFKIVTIRHFKIKINLTKKINLPNQDLNLTPSVRNHSPTVQSCLLSFLLTKKQRSSNFAHRLASKMRFESLPIEIKPPIPTLCSGISSALNIRSIILLGVKRALDGCHCSQDV